MSSHPSGRRDSEQNDSSEIAPGRRTDYSELSIQQAEHLLEQTKNQVPHAESVGAFQIPFAGGVLRMIWLVFHEDTEKNNTETSFDDFRLTHSVATIPTELIAEVLNNLFDYHELANNPLSQNLNLSRHRRGDDPPALAPGYALHRALNEALDQFTGAAPRSIYDKGLHIHHYLHFRYREEVSHKDLAIALDYDPRHLRRIRRDLLHRFGEVLFLLNPRR